MVEMNQSRDTQVEKYGGEAGYSEEMKRRRKLVKAPGFKSMDPEKRLAAARLGGLNSRKNKQADMGQPNRNEDISLKYGKQTEEGRGPR